MKQKCYTFESGDHPSEYLLASDRVEEIASTYYVKQSTGRAVTDYMSNIPPNSQNWILVSVNATDNTYYIYHQVMNGFLNTYVTWDLNHYRRYIFVGNDRKDVWKLYRHPKVADFYYVENVPTAEFMYAVTSGRLNEREKVNRGVYTWKFQSFSELLEDTSGNWRLRECNSYWPLLKNFV